MVKSAANGTPINPQDLTGGAAAAYYLLLSLGVNPADITVYQADNGNFSAVLTGAGFQALQNAQVNLGFFDAALHYPYTDGGRDDNPTASLHFVWMDETLTNSVGGSGIYMDFHVDSFNPSAGEFWRHLGCNMLHLCTLELVNCDVNRVNPTSSLVTCLFALVLLGVPICLGGHTRSPSRETATKPYLNELRMEKLSKFLLSLDIANNSSLAAAALSDLRIRVWRLDSGEVVHEFAFPEPESDQRLKLEEDVEPISVRFSPNGKTLAVSFLSGIHLYDVGTWHEEEVLGVDGEDLLREGYAPKLTKRPPPEQAQREKTAPTLNDLYRQRAALLFQGDGRTRITDFTFTGNGSFILTGYCRGSCYAMMGHRRSAFPSGKDPVRLWDVRSKKIIWERQYDPKGVIDRVVASPDGKRFAAVDAELGRCAVGIYDLSDGRALLSLPATPFCSPPPSLNFLPDGEHLITARAELGDHKNRSWKNLAMYEASTGRLISDFSRRDEVREADLSSDGRWLASTTWWGTRFQIWDVQARKPILSQTPKEWRWKGPPIERVRFSPDGRWLVVGSDAGGTLVVYRFGPSSSNLLQSFSFRRSLAWAASGEFHARQLRVSAFPSPPQKSSETAPKISILGSLC